MAQETQKVGYINNGADIKNIQKDGNVFVEGDRILFDDFQSESEMVDYIISNIDSFTNIHLNDRVVSFEVDKDIAKQAIRCPRGRRIDIFIRGEKGIYILECKNSKNTSNTRAGIGQLLDYGREFLDPKKELILVSNVYDSNTAKTIEYYNLPIRYLILNKVNTLEFKETICKDK